MPWWSARTACLRGWAETNGHLLAPLDATHLGYRVGIWLKNARAAARKAAEIEQRRAKGLPVESSAASVYGTALRRRRARGDRARQGRPVAGHAMPGLGMAECRAARAQQGGAPRSGISWPPCSRPGYSRAIGSGSTRRPQRLDMTAPHLGRCLPEHRRRGAYGTGRRPTQIGPALRDGGGARCLPAVTGSGRGAGVPETRGTRRGEGRFRPRSEPRSAPPGRG